MTRVRPNTREVLGLIVVTVIALSASCSRYRHGCFGGPCRSHILVRVNLNGTLPKASQAFIRVRGVVIKRNHPAPALDTEGLPDPKGKHPHTVFQIIELNFKSSKRLYEDTYRWDLLSDDKAWLYAFVDLNNNDYLDPGEPYGVLRGAPKVVPVCKTTRVTITIDLSRRWKGKKRW